MDEDIRMENKIPNGCEKFTRPEEIKALGKYLRAKRKDLEERTKLETDNLEIFGRRQGNLKNIEELPDEIDVLNTKSNVSGLVSEKEWLKTGKKPDELERRRLDIKENNVNSLPDEKERLKKIKDLENILGERAEKIPRDKRNDLLLEQTKEILKNQEKINDLPKEKLEIGDERKTNLSNTKINIEDERKPELGDFIDSIEDDRKNKLEKKQEKILDKRENNLSSKKEKIEDKRNTELSNQLEKIKDKRKTELESQVEKIEDLRRIKLEDNKLNLNDTRENKLSSTREDLEDDRRNKLEEGKLKLEDKREIGLSNFSETLEDNRITELSQYQETITDSRKNKLEDKVEKIETKETNNLSDYIENIEDDRKTELENYLDTINDVRDQELSNKLEKIEDTRKINLENTREDLEVNKDLELSKNLETLEDNRITELSQYQETITDSRKNKLEDKVEKIETKETNNLSDYIENIEDDHENALSKDIEKYSVPDEVPILPTTPEKPIIRPEDVENLEYTVDPLFDERVVDLSQTRIDIEGEKEIETLEDHIENLENTKESSKLEEYVEPLEDKRDDINLSEYIDSIKDEREVDLSEVREDIEDNRENELKDYIDPLSDDRENELSSIREDLEDERENNLSDTIIGLEKNEDPEALYDSSLAIPDGNRRGDEDEELEDERLDLKDNRENQLEDYVNSLNDPRENNLEDYIDPLTDNRENQLENYIDPLEDNRENTLEDFIDSLEDDRENELENYIDPLEDTRENNLEDYIDPLSDDRENELENYIDKRGDNSEEHNEFIDPDEALLYEDSLAIPDGNRRGDEDEELEDERLDLEDNRENQLEDYIDPLTDNRENGLEDYIDPLEDNRENTLEDFIDPLSDDREPSLLGDETKKKEDDANENGWNEELEDERLDLKDNRENQLLGDETKKKEDDANENGWNEELENYVDIRGGNLDDIKELYSDSLARPGEDKDTKLEDEIKNLLPDDTTKDNWSWGNDGVGGDNDSSTGKHKQFDPDFDSLKDKKIERDNDFTEKTNISGKSQKSLEKELEEKGDTDSLADHTWLSQQAFKDGKFEEDGDKVKMSSDDTTKDNWSWGNDGVGGDNDSSTSKHKQFDPDSDKLYLGSILSSRDDVDEYYKKVQEFASNKKDLNIGWRSKIQAILTKYTTNKNLSQSDFENFEKEIMQAAMTGYAVPIKRDDGKEDKTNMTGEIQGLNGGSDEKFAKRAEGVEYVPIAKTPEFFGHGASVGSVIDGLNPNNYLRWAVERTVGQAIHGSLRQLAIDEALALLVLARDELEELTEGNRDRLPGSTNILGDLASGGVGKAVSGAIGRGVNSLLGADGPDYSIPSNRPKVSKGTRLLGGKKREDTTGWTKLNDKKEGVVTPGGGDAGSNLLGKLKSAAKSMISGSDNSEDYVFANELQYLQGEGIKTTLEELCGKDPSSLSSIEDLFKSFKKSPYMTTASKVASTGDDCLRVRTLDSNAYWEIIFEPFVGDENGGVSFLPPITEINRWNLSFHGVNTGYNRWVPVNSFELGKSKLNSKTLSLFDGEISYPISMEFTNEFRLTFVDDQYKSWRTYFERSAETMVYNSIVHDSYDYGYDTFGNYKGQNYNTFTTIDKSYVVIAPYKNVTFRCTIFCMTPQRSTISKYDLLLTLKDFAEERSGEIDGAGSDLTVAFSIVGENPAPRGGLASYVSSKPAIKVNKLPDRYSPASIVSSGVNNVIGLL